MNAKVYIDKKVEKGRTFPDYHGIHVTVEQHRDRYDDNHMRIHCHALRDIELHINDRGALVLYFTDIHNKQHMHELGHV